MQFSVICRELANYVEDCYFCVVNSFVYNAKNKHTVIYPSVPSAIILLPQSDELEQPVFYELPRSDVLQKSFFSFMPLHYE